MKQKIIGIFWFIASLCCSITNDAITKYKVLPPGEVLFFRLFFGSCYLLILLPYLKVKISFANLRLHFFRALLLVCAMGLWIHGTQRNPLVNTTIISFTIPIFVLLFARFILHEAMNAKVLIATTISMLGALIMLKGHHVAIYSNATLFLLLASAIFAVMDVINKKYIVQESMINMLFFINFFAAIMALPLTMVTWQQPSPVELGLLGLLGCSSIAILYCLLKAFSLIPITITVPLRYIELLLSISTGYLIFWEIPTLNAIIGAAFIIPATLWVTISKD